VTAALKGGAEVLSSEGIVSVFVRLHPLLEPSAPGGIGSLVRHGDTVSIDLTLDRDTLWSQLRRNHRQQIRQSIDAGNPFSVDSDARHWREFRRLYHATMSRVNADAYYFFDDAYFDGLREALDGQIHLGVVEIDGDVAAAGLFVETCGIVEMHLTAHDERFLATQPMKHVFHGITEWAQDRGARVMHLGGGRGGAEDSLLHFKSGFSPLRNPFHTLRIVARPMDYRRLVAERDPSADPSDVDGYFPLYRRT
jgi:lipid II:glycine glycyltransferase (peptidoglycan interpeptide bridge formation enzyme)